jgi:hypothetical protein
MKAAYERVMYAGLGAASFLQQHDEKLPSLRNSPVRRQLEEAVARLTEHSRDQARLQMELKGQFKRQKWLESRLRSQHLFPIAQYARVCVAQAPEYQALAVSVAHVKGQALVDAAYAMEKAGAPLLGRRGHTLFPADTIERLRAAADELQATIQLRAKLKVERVQATEGITAAAGRAVEAMRQLTAILEHRLQHDRPLLAAWRKARGLAQLS